MRELAVSRAAATLLVSRLTLLSSKGSSLTFGAALKFKEALLKFRILLLKLSVLLLQVKDQFVRLGQLRFQLGNTLVTRIFAGFAHRWVSL